jgi:hypothetical protein
LLVFTGTAVVEVASPLPAHASPCSNSSLDCTDPVSTGCSSSASTIDTVLLEGGGVTGGGDTGYVQLRYATSSSCRTVWSRILIFGTYSNYYPWTNRQVGPAGDTWGEGAYSSVSCDLYDCVYSRQLADAGYEDMAWGGYSGGCNVFSSPSLGCFDAYTNTIQY